MPAALSACGCYMVLSIPPTCSLQQVRGSKPQINFVRAPPGLRGLQPLNLNGIYMAWENSRALVTWNGNTGEVLHHVSPQDFGESAILVTALGS